MGRELQKNIHHVGNEKNEIIKIIKNIVSCVKNNNELKSGYHKKNTANNISIKLKEVFKMNDVTIIAEAGVNHNGNIKNAFKLIDIAKKKLVQITLNFKFLNLT